MDKLSEWVETFPSSNKKAQTVFWLPPPDYSPIWDSCLSLVCNRPQFTFQTSQTLSKVLSILWHFHIQYYPQPPGKTEKTNCSLKYMHVKMSQELHRDWVKKKKKKPCLWLFSGSGLSSKELFPSHPLNSCMGSWFWLPASHLNPYLSLITYSRHYWITSSPSYGTLLTNCLPWPCAKPCPCPINIRD